MACLFSGTAQADTNIRLVLDWSFQGQHAMFTMPADDGTYKRLGLTVTVDRGAGSGDAVTKVASGAYDLGLGDLYAMVRFNAEHPNRKLIAVMVVDDRSALAVELKASSSIKTPKDLDGKTIAAPLGDASRQLFPLFAAVNGIDEKTMKWITISPDLREPLLVRGDTDAITGHLTTVMLNLSHIGLKSSDVRTMPYVDFGVNLLGHVVFARPEFAEKNPEAVRNFIRAAAHGFNAMMKDPDAAASSIKARDALTDKDLERARLKMSLDYRMLTDNVRKNGISNVDLGRLRDSLEKVAGPLQIKDIPPPSDVYTDRYLPPRGELQLQQ